MCSSRVDVGGNGPLTCHMFLMVFILFAFAHKFSLVFGFISDLLAVEINDGLLNVLNKGLDLVRNKRILMFKKKKTCY